LEVSTDILEEHSVSTLRVDIDIIPEDRGKIFPWNGVSICRSM
jgi:hypothetical protein